MQRKERSGTKAGLGDAPLSLRWETRGHWSDLRTILPGLTETGAAIAIALWSEALTEGRDVSYSRTLAHYAGRPATPLYTYERVRSGIAFLDRAGLLSDHFIQAAGARGRQSTCRASDRLMRIVGDVMAARPRLVPLRPREAVVIRDAEGIARPLPRTEEVRRMQRRVEAINEMLRSVHLSDGAGACYTRIFHGDLRRGGRFYAQGRSWQGMSEDTRKAITIDGEDVIELDFRSQHMSMIYSDAGMPLSPDDDPYDVPGIPRPISKAASLIMINASDWHDAVHALAHDSVWEKKIGIAPGSREAADGAAKAIRAMARKHRPVKHAFFSDAGAGLMRTDSDIADDVMTRLMKRGTVALCVHDSFVVPASKADELRETMLSVAHDQGYPSMRLKAA